MIILAADQAFNGTVPCPAPVLVIYTGKMVFYAGHGKVLHKLAEAVAKGHLKPISFIAQKLSIYGLNL